MILWFIVIILIIWVWIALSMYSMYVPFVKDIGDMKFYNMAYYWAQSSIERAYLALRYHKPGFEAKWWRDSQTNSWLSSDKLSNFWFLTKWSNHIKREIDSQTTKIPQTWTTNLPNMYFEQSSGFNWLYYNVVKKISLETDTTQGDSDKVYSNSTLSFKKFDWDKISIIFRLNPQIYNILNKIVADWWKLANWKDMDDDKVTDEAVMNRSLWWTLLWYDFTIYPVERIKYYTNYAIVQPTDQMIRESVINSTYPATPTQVVNFEFTDRYNPIVWKYDWTWLNAISKEDLWSDTFKDIFTDNDYQHLYFTFDLINYLESRAWTMYPFLEYSIDFHWHKVPDEYYNIIWEWQVWNFKIQMISKKPSNDQQYIASDFTIIF